MKILIDQVDKSLTWDGLSSMSRQLLDYALAIQQIPSPTFHEERRASYLKAQFGSLSLAEVEVDDESNMFALLPGLNRNAPSIMISAHTDTVFAENTDLQTRTEEGVIYGPGLGDNSMGVASLLTLARFFQQQKIMPECDLWFVATTGEEGLGDLKGMKCAFRRLKPRVGCVINLEGLAFGHIYHAGIAVRRLRITATAEGGHSWLHFGRPNAIHGLVELGARIVGMRPPQSPRTTYNIGVIEGGHSVNSIAGYASLWLDLRSEDPKALETLEQHVRAHVDAVTKHDLNFTIEIVGDRPAGSIPADHPLVLGAMRALEVVGTQGVLETGSTDGNIPLAEGCPAITIGITRGGNAHRLDEYIETSPVESGLRQLILLVLAAAIHQAQQELKQSS
jgi:acetylornithine deacetylase/succinyl-diaminopimelate desuccinylase-like protein